MPTTCERKPGKKLILSPEETEVARQIQGDIPLTGRPFQRIAKGSGLTEGEVLSITGNLREKGIIRKFGAIVRHQRVGYAHNVMVIWAVPPAWSTDVGEKFSTFAEVTHCYERTPPFAGVYNLFTMVHLRKAEDEDLLGKMAEAVGIRDFKVLRSLEEFKKQSMEYF
jgi:DNA-binding Lrp family transcriptional regulator